MKERIVEYIKSNISNENLENLSLQDDLLGNGIIDSMGMMKLIDFIEKESKISIPPEDMTVENFMTIECILDYLS